MIGDMPHEQKKTRQQNSTHWNYSKLAMHGKGKKIYYINDKYAIFWKQK